MKGVSREKSLDRILSWGGISIDRFEKKKVFGENELYKGFISILVKWIYCPEEQITDFIAIMDI